MRALLAGLVLLGMGCASAPRSGSPIETRHDLVRAFEAHGWTVRPVRHSRLLDALGRGAVYRVEGKTVVVFDYASPAEASARDDAGRFVRLHAGLGVEVYRRSALVVLTVGRTRTDFDLRLAALLSGPPAARAGWN